MIIHLSFAFLTNITAERYIYIFGVVFVVIWGFGGACIVTKSQCLRFDTFFSFPLKPLKYIHPVIHIRGVNGFSEDFFKSQSKPVTL